MMSIVVGPTQGSGEAVCDLGRLIATSPEAHRDWLAQPVTRLMLRALREASQGRAPQPGLSPHDYAQAVGEVAGDRRRERAGAGTADL